MLVQTSWAGPLGLKTGFPLDLTFFCEVFCQSANVKKNNQKSGLHTLAQDRRIGGKCCIVKKKRHKWNLTSNKVHFGWTTQQTHNSRPGSPTVPARLRLSLRESGPTTKIDLRLHVNRLEQLGFHVVPTWNPAAFPEFSFKLCLKQTAWTASALALKQTCRAQSSEAKAFLFPWHLTVTTN